VTGEGSHDAQRAVILRSFHGDNEIDREMTNSLERKKTDGWVKLLVPLGITEIPAAFDNL